jgi:hypothetical protein
MFSFHYSPFTIHHSSRIGSVTGPGLAIALLVLLAIKAEFSPRAGKMPVLPRIGWTR